ncbi:MAG: ABC transporter ATP-binding protein [Treponema sp.]|nr:ABC transporter ATP-binding protein [Treponema sp.]
MKVRLENISKSFGQNLAVDNFSAILPDGKLICLLGPSGCGKSTLLNMLCGILEASQGKIFFDEEEVSNLPPDQRGIGMVFQNYALYPHMTVLDNISFPLEVQKLSRKERKEKAIEIAKLVHVDNLLSRYPGELSGGQQQRVAIARALVKNPKLLLMDEPLSNLDARLRLEMREEIRRIQKETKVTTIFVTHDQEEAMSISDSIFLMKKGSLIQEGICQELYNQPNCQFVADFLGNPPINKIQIEYKALMDLFNTLGKKIENPEKLENRSLLLAIRPEAFNLDKKIKGKILSISEMGKEEILTLDFLNHTVRAIINSEEELEVGQEISLGLKNKGIFIFDSNSGERLF